MTPNFTIKTPIPDSILSSATGFFQGETTVFPPALESLSGLQAAASGWMNLRGHSGWGKHQCWWLTREVERGRGINIPPLITLWDALLHEGRLVAEQELKSRIEKTSQTHPTVYHTANTFVAEEQGSFRRLLEVDHLSAFHVDYYNANLRVIANYITEVVAKLHSLTEDGEWQVNLRHPIVTPNQHHQELLTQDGDNLIRLLYKVPALSSNCYTHLWESQGISQFGTEPHPWLFPADAFDSESNLIHRVYNSWMRFNAYATVTHKSDASEPYGAIHSDLIHPTLLHNTTEFVSIPSMELPRIGIHDKAVIYRPVHKTLALGTQNIKGLMEITYLTSLLCQLLTAFSNGKKGSRGVPKTRWSSSPANITWGKTLFAIAPGIYKDL